MVKVRIPNTPKEPAGILKFVEKKWRSIVVACKTGKVCWLMVTAIIMPVDQMGRTLISDLSSSTCCVVHKFHGCAADPSGFKSSSGFLIMQALFRNLRRDK